MEIFKPVVGYEGLYEVSNYGRVRSFDRIIPSNGSSRLLRGKIMSITKKTVQVTLTKESNSVKGCRVARLVYTSFVGEIPDGMDIYHKDRNRHNNNIANLIVCTRSETQASASTRKTTTHRGVYKTDNRFSVHLRGKSQGRYDTIEEAMAARREMNIKAFGSFAPENNP